MTDTSINYDPKDETTQEPGQAGNQQPSGQKGGESSGQPQDPGKTTDDTEM